ncbi:NADPH dehydrogenase NamA [Treponema sp. OMZ 840]|uniref:NADPH dehydrogenase NamA n=1 Tax=Treponema sp. OMZ 840 TaxID=244313 RepID=UPI003D94ED12
MAHLFSKYAIKNLELKNRLVMAPMCMFCAPETGTVTDFHIMHYAARALGGTGLITVEATAVSPEGRISENDLGIWSDDFIPGLQKIADAIHDYGSKAALQIGHAGRKSRVQGIELEAPSAIAFDEKSAVPKEMTNEDIQDTVEEFKQAAARADKAGFDMIQLHAAHGYLLSEFLSPLTNKRCDEYGGNPENRVRILGDVLDAIQSVWKDKPIEVRVSADDYAEGGNTAEDIALMLNIVKHKGIDSVNVSTGGTVNVAPNAFTNYQIPHAKVIREQTGLPVAAGGLIVSAKEANDVIAADGIEQVYVGRELLRNPYFALNAAKELKADIEFPKQYMRAYV